MMSLAADEDPGGVIAAGALAAGARSPYHPEAPRNAADCRKIRHLDLRRRPSHSCFRWHDGCFA